MAMRRFVEAIGREATIVHSGIDRIPGTKKVRTFSSSPSGLYSKQSDLQNLVSTNCCSPGKQKTLMPPKPTYRQGR